jgi:nicotinamide riboside transporter PnuC
MGLTYWLLALVATLGCVLNNGQRKEGFIVWMFTNLAWAAVFFQEGQFAQSFQFAVQTLFAVHGLITWTRKEQSRERRELWLDWRAIQRWATIRHGRRRSGI